MTESRSMRLNSIDYVYVLLSSFAGVWQAWCFNHGSDNVLVLTLISMSVPFVLLSYVHASLLSRLSRVADTPDWKRVLVIWAGMPLSLVLGSLTILAESGMMHAAGLGVVDLPFYTLRLLIGEGAACLGWAWCLTFWVSAESIRARGAWLPAFASLYVGVLLAAGLSELIRRSTQKDFSFLLTSIVTTTTSALIVALLSERGIKQLKGRVGGLG